MSASVFFCGDIINMFSHKQFIGDNLRRVIQSCDYAVGNLEGVINSENSVVKPMMQNRSTINTLKEAGFNLLLLANNHIADYGTERLSDTIAEIDEQGLSHIGAGTTYNDVYQTLTTTIKGVKIGFLNMCEAQVGHWDLGRKGFGYAWIGDIGISSRINELRKNVDFVVACVHGGLEHNTLPLPYFRQYYRMLCDMGVDCVVGSHPHIVQGIERYSNSLIFYSLGNFFFPRKPDSGKEDKENSAFSVVVDFEKDKSIKYKVVHHSISDLTVELEQNPIWDEEELSRMLLSPQYEHESEKMLKEVYLQHVRPQLSYAMMGTETSDTFLTKVKKIIKYLFFDYRATQLQRDKLLNRLVVNETYRSIIDTVTNQSINK